MEASTTKGKSILRPTKSVGFDFDDKPLSNHVQILMVAPNGSGNRIWSCNFCNKRVTGSYSKVKAHLLKLFGHGVAICKEISNEVCPTLKMENEEAEKKKSMVQLDARKKADYVSLPQVSDLSQQKKQKGSTGGALEKSFSIANRNIADKLAARMFYASGLSFNLATSPYFKKYSEFLAANPIPGYIPPTYNRLRTTLLAQEKTNINIKLQPIRDKWKRKGLSICSDG
ncbi:hypothetical protein CQW23_00900 [Capsicum baccatum]|uniref:BED-type domain-containing protein n=1 Tax=Capsicum baccatum TaxID=33114 RepID=A0A2G2XM26_CAPBA|nr:hypothetical protein CQW23_00900 [Capsicum baccatum]